MSKAFNSVRFTELLEQFRLLNPEQIELIGRELEELAVEGKSKAFEQLAEIADDVLRLYLNSPVKMAEKAALDSFFRYFNKTTRNMIKAGELPSDDSPASTSVALVPNAFYNSLQWVQIKSRIDLPEPIAGAVEAGRRRSELVRSVLEPMFLLMLKADFEKAVEWQLARAGSPEEPIDPDVARDMLRAWKSVDVLPSPLLKKAIAWASDESAHRYWPVLAIECDSLLRRQCLRAWHEQDESPHGSAATLRRLHPYTDDRRLTSWLKRCVSKLGESIDFFCEQAELVAGKDTDESEGWRKDAMFQELVSVNDMAHPLLLLSDLLLSQPNGTMGFAMAFFGFTTAYKEKWERRLVEQCRIAVRKCFLRDLRLKRKPAMTIHMLSFGNRDFEQQMLNELDLFTENFDSIPQRERVVERLAYMYASFREPGLLAQDVAFRYRRTMRVLHEDNLRRVLRQDQFEQLDRFAATLSAMSTLASQCRRFISIRRSLDNDTEELIAADLDFRKEIRSLRTSFIRNELSI